MPVLAVITARGGSVTLPHKNVLSFCGRPLVAWTVRAAVDAREQGAPIDRILISTDDPEIAQAARTAGADAPFLRPEYLARSDTPSLPVVQHAVAFAEEQAGAPYDWVLLLQPTSPLRSAGDIIAAFELACGPGVTAVVSVTCANESHPAKLKLVEGTILKPYLPGGFTPKRRQDLGFDVFRTNGAIYLARRDVLIEGGSFYGSDPRAYVMPAERSVDVDTRLDFEIAEFLHRRSQAGQQT